MENFRIQDLELARKEYKEIVKKYGENSPEASSLKEYLDALENYSKNNQQKGNANGEA